MNTHIHIKHDERQWDGTPGAATRLTIETPTAHVDIYRRRWTRNTTRREMYAKPRLYVGSDAAFSLVEDLENRTRRPFKVWREALRDLFDELNYAGIHVDFAASRWSQHAGCSCPCSPGFILTQQTVRFADFDTACFDVFVRLKGAATIDDTLPKRDVFGPGLVDDELVDA